MKHISAAVILAAIAACGGPRPASAPALSPTSGTSDGAGRGERSGTTSDDALAIVAMDAGAPLAPADAAIARRGSDEDSLPVYVATCVTSLGGDRMSDGFALVVLARFVHGTWEDVTITAPRDDHGSAHAVLDLVLADVRHAKWTAVRSARSPNEAGIGNRFQTAHAIALDNFEQRALHAVAIGSCTANSAMMLYTTGHVDAATAVPGGARDVAEQTMTRAIGAPYAHWWLAARHSAVLLVGGNFSGSLARTYNGMDPPGGGSERSAYEGRWFGTYDPQSRTLSDWHLIHTSHY